MISTESAYHIPDGTKNVATLFPSISWKDVEEYYLVINNLEGDPIATTCNNKIVGGIEDNTVRLHFLNSLGMIDAVNFCQVQEDYDIKSDNSEKPLSYPLIKSDGGSARYNIRANESYKVITTLYSEEQMKWLKELFSSPAVWVEWKGTQGQADDYLPVVLADAKYTTLKIEERYTYQVTVEYRLSNQDITIRN
ncbi:hypothetical protein [Chitinophaga tropicalis]|uniref:Uncharacterized protein n=1 Tax=Chitinophaga tropicalis TaxID=2683588 RepID=A0A7K1UBM1_9BACT|nr:hypothetical protein [Chitinophaga tropicalis]MVT11375.1 hypothetical protein [Chitinophaga tropicalis]